MKKFLALILSLCMLLTFVPAFSLVTMAEEYTAEDDTVFYISFDEELPEGSTGYNLSILDEGVYGNCAWFNGSTSYIHLPDNITQGVEDFTMAAWINVTGTTKGWQRVFDLGNGTGNYAFLGIPYATTDIRGAVKVNNGAEQNATASGVVSKNEWMHIAFVQEGNVGTVYINGEAKATTSLSSTLAAMGNTSTNYIGRSQFSSDPYFNGYLDEVVFAKRAMSADEIAAMGVMPTPVINEETILADIDIPVKDSVKENITLQTEALGYPVTWASSDESVVYPYDIPNGDYTIPAGRVTRQAEDTTVTLTATVDYNGTILTKDIPVNVIAAPEAVGDTEAYLYVYVRGNVKGSNEHLSIHLAGSEDGYEWFDLNGNWPILESTMGTQCLRDPYLLRSKDGDRFYLIATDLNTQDGQGWGPWSLEGSKYLMIWESDDLVNWSEQRMVKFANDDMGCAWAPEAIWDPDTEEYLVYASAKDLTLGSSAIDTVYVVRTRDFRTFSEPEYFVRPYEDNGVTTYGEGTKRIAAIDSNIIRANDGKFYHFYKKYNSVVQMLVSDHASGPYEEVPGYTPIGGEGPGSFLVKGTDNTYALLIDNYSVYVPYLTEDIASGIFTAGSGTVKMPTGSKHGGFLPINAEEYARVLEAYGSPTPDETGSDARYTFDFESDVTEYLNGNATVAYSEEKGSNVLVLDGNNSYFEFPEGIFDRQDAMTLSFDVKNTNTNAEAAYMTFSLGTGDKYYYFYKTNSNTMRSAINVTSPVTSNAYTYEEKAISNTLGDLTNTWMHIDLVMDGYSMKVYKDGVLVAENNDITTTISHIGLEGLSAYLGKSMYSADPYFVGEFDNVELYYRALTAGEIAENTGNTEEDMAKLDAEAVNFGYDVNYVTGNITLPSTGVYGSTITWATSDDSVIDLDGNVSVPTEGVKTVTLTGTFVYGDTTYVKEYALLVKPVTSYLTSTLADAWKTYDITSAEGNVTYTFNITPSALTDGVVALTSSSTTATGYGSYSMLMRVQPNGTFDAYNGSSYQKTNTIYYEAGKTYPVTIVANIASKTYSVFVEIDGETKTIADNFRFRAQNSEIGKLTVMGGHGIEAGLVTVTDFNVTLPAAIRFENVVLSGGKVTGNVISEEELGESIVIVASYNTDGSLMSAKAVGLVGTAFEADVTTENVKVMLWNSVSGMVPYLEAVTVE